MFGDLDKAFKMLAIFAIIGFIASVLGAGWLIVKFVLFLIATF